MNNFSSALREERPDTATMAAIVQGMLVTGNAPHGANTGRAGPSSAKVVFWMVCALLLPGFTHLAANCFLEKGSLQPKHSPPPQGGLDHRGTHVGRLLFSLGESPPIEELVAAPAVCTGVSAQLSSYLLNTTIVIKH